MCVLALTITPPVMLERTIDLKTLKYLTAFALTALLVVTVGCGGHSTPATTPTPTATPVQVTSTFTFAVPITPLSAGADSVPNGDIQMFLDGNLAVKTNFTPQFDGSGNTVTGAGPSGSSADANVSFTSVIAAKALNVTVTLKALSETPHTFGVVRLNGACSTSNSAGVVSCLGNIGAGYVMGNNPGINNGYVLQEGQTSFTSHDGTNNTFTLQMQGVLEAAYLCDANCDGHADGPDANGVYSFKANVTDESGGAPADATYSSGQWEVVELDGKGIVNITNPGPFSKPQFSASGWDRQAVTFTCNSYGDTVIAARLLPNSPSKGVVTGFNYTPQNYPTPSAVLGNVGAILYFGNTLSVHCN